MPKSQEKKVRRDYPRDATDPNMQKAFDAAFLQAKIDAVRFNTGLIVQRDGKLTHIKPEELIPDIEAAGLEVVIVRPKKPGGEAV